MDIRSYIQSGVLEEYVLGILTSEAAAEVAQNARLYPVIQQELEAIEKALEKYAISFAKTPPSGTLENILRRIDTSAAGSATATPSFWSRLKPKNLSRFLAIAMTVKFLLAATGLGFLYFQNQKLHRRFEAKQEQLTQAQSTCDSTASILQKEIKFLKDVGTRPVALAGTPLAPQALAAVHFNSKERKAYLTNIDLPAPPSGKQYQLWAIVEGKPVSMGVLELPQGKDTLLDIPFVENAAAFAISLEDAGGKPQPTMDQIYVMGAVTTTG